MSPVNGKEKKVATRYLNNEGGVRFVALVQFYDEDFKSWYEPGLSYTIRPGNEKLAIKAAKWKQEGKIIIGGVSGSGAQPAVVKAVGEVK